MTPPPTKKYGPAGATREASISGVRRLAIDPNGFDARLLRAEQLLTELGAPAELWQLLHTAALRRDALLLDTLVERAQTLKR